jgi:hypothetical protein
MDCFRLPQELQWVSCHRVQVIFKRVELLSNILQRHEETLRRRWLKMAFPKRKEILLAVDSEILTRVWTLESPPREGFVIELDMMDRLAQQKPTVKYMLSTFCWEHFSHLSTSTEHIQQIRSYQPWATQMEQDILHLDPNTPAIFSDATEDYYMKLTAKWKGATMLKKLDDRELLKVG